MNQIRERCRVIPGILLGTLLLGAAVGVGFASSLDGTCADSASAGPVDVVGAFTNMRYSGEHAYGYSVQLWRQVDRLFGLLFVSDGLAGDTPVGLLENGKYESATSRFAFLARLSTGLFSDKTHREVPSRDVFQWKGVLRENTLEGEMVVSNELDPKRVARRETLTLQRSAEESVMMIGAHKCSEWRLAAEQILKSRGPKW